MPTSLPEDGNEPSKEESEQPKTAVIQIKCSDQSESTDAEEGRHICSTPSTKRRAKNNNVQPTATPPKSRDHCHYCICEHPKCREVTKGFRGTGHIYDRAAIRLTISDHNLWPPFFESLMRNLHLSDKTKTKLLSSNKGFRFSVAAHHFTKSAVEDYWNNRSLGTIYKLRFDEKSALKWGIVHLPLDPQEKDEYGYFIAANFPVDEAVKLMEVAKSEKAVMKFMDEELTTTEGNTDHLKSVIDESGNESMSEYPIEDPKISTLSKSGASSGKSATNDCELESETTAKYDSETCGDQEKQVLPTTDTRSENEAEASLTPPVAPIESTALSGKVATKDDIQEQINADIRLGHIIKKQTNHTATCRHGNSKAHSCICGYPKCRDVSHGFCGTGHTYDRASITFRICNNKLWDSFFERLLENQNLRVSDEKKEALRKNKKDTKFYVAAHHFNAKVIEKYWSNKVTQQVWKLRLSRKDAYDLFYLPPDPSDSDWNGEYCIKADFPFEEAVKLAQVKMKESVLPPGRNAKEVRPSTFAILNAVAVTVLDGSSKSSDGRTKERKCICSNFKCQDVMSGFFGTGHVYGRPPIRLTISDHKMWAPFFESLLRNLNPSDEMKAKLLSKGKGYRFSVAAHHFTSGVVSKYWTGKKGSVYQTRLDEDTAYELLHLPLDSRDRDEHGYFINANFPFEDALKIMYALKSERAVNNLSPRKEAKQAVATAPTKANEISCGKSQKGTSLSTNDERNDDQDVCVESTKITTVELVAGTKDASDNEPECEPISKKRAIPPSLKQTVLEPTEKTRRLARIQNGTKTVVISGVTSGLGRALLAHYYNQKHRVAGCGRRVEEIEFLQQMFPDAKLSVVDVTSDSAVADWVDEICGTRGDVSPSEKWDVDVVIANAGTSPETALGNQRAWEVPLAAFDITLDINVRGVANMMRHFIPRMIDSAAANQQTNFTKCFVAMSSELGRSPDPYHAAYCSSKWAIEGMMKSLAMSLPEPLCAVPLAPGVVETGMMPGSAGCSTVDDWVKVAGPMILGLGREDNGKSLSVEGFYTEKYKSTWTIEDAVGIPEELGHDFSNSDEPENKAPIKTFKTGATIDL